jgi:biopolymer transport protein ExbD
MKLIYLPSIILLLLLLFTVAAEPIDNIMNLLKQGNTQELAKLFSNNIEVTVLDADNVYVGTEATTALTKFFVENKPQSVKLFHKIDSNPNYLFAVIFLTADKGIYRVSLTLNKVDAAMKIIELRIESEKTK